MIAFAPRSAMASPQARPSAFEAAVETMGWLRAMLSVIVIDRN
ncbi:hypothetical protein [uncultured Jannaschia sp.]|nr:hypothetical protein [uncultured Jannaschia sp.]